MTYKEKLLDPRWQKKRLEVLESDYWSCRACESKTGTLHVHHLWYEKDCDPWDYPNECLITLCDKCHEKAPKINWQRALLELNIPEKHLLNLASVLAYKKKQLGELTRSVQEKFKTRNIAWYYTIEADLFSDTDELQDFYRNFEKEFLDKYTEE